MHWFVSKCLEVFLSSCCCDFLFDSLEVREHTLYEIENEFCVKIQFFWTYLDLFYGLGYSLSWHMFFEHLRKMYILRLLGRVFWKCWLDFVGWWCFWVVLYPCWLPSYFINFWERNVEIWKCKCGFMFLFFSVLSGFASHILYLCCLMHVILGLLCLLGGLTFYHYIIFLSLLTSAARMLKLEQYREDEHAPEQGWHTNLWSVPYFC